MRALNNRQLGKWLMREVHGVEIPRKPPRKAYSALGNPPARNWKYRSWIRTLPCAHCGTTHQVEAAHTGSDGGMRQKASDYSCVPLCHDCHQAHPVSYHRNREAMGIDWQALVSRLNSIWFAPCSRGKVVSMAIVLVNPINKKPTVFAPAENTPRIFSGPYQNVLEVTDGWLAAERERLKNIMREKAEALAKAIDELDDERTRLLDG